MNLLEINQLQKKFGTQTVLDDLCLQVPEGSVYGFLGQNGAGKTTTMKLILGLLRADGGSITVNGERVQYGQTATNRFLGYLPDVPAFYSYMKPMEYLSLCGAITGLDAQTTKDRAKELLALVGLEQVKKRIGGFSRGMKQRLGIAQALINRPKLLLCDEPTSALDPIGRKELLSILQSVKSQTTVLFSTHILSDVERICDRAAVIHGGKIVLDGTLQDLKDRRRHDVLGMTFATQADADRFQEQFSAPELLGAVEWNGLTVQLHASRMDALQQQIFAFCQAQALYPRSLEILEPTLENLYLEAVK